MGGQYNLDRKKRVGADVLGILLLLCKLAAVVGWGLGVWP